MKMASRGSHYFSWKILNILSKMVESTSNVPKDLHEANFRLSPLPCMLIIILFVDQLLCLNGSGGGANAV